MTHDDTLQRIFEAGIVAVVRHSNPAPLLQAMAALADGGVTVMEVTLTVPHALDVIRQAKQELGDRIVLGAGTVLTSEQAEQAADAGAEFIVSPTLNEATIEKCDELDLVVMPGCFTPTEILAAWNAGADVIKVFPAESLGPAFFKAMRGPLPQIKLMPTGGVDLTTARSYLEAGAVCLGVGSQLVDPKLLASGDFESLKQRASQFAKIVTDFRSRL